MKKSYYLSITFDGKKVVALVVESESGKVVAAFQGTDRDRVINDAEEYMRKQQGKS